MFSDAQKRASSLGIGLDFGQKESGGKVEILLERVLDSQRFLAHVRASKAPKPDTIILVFYTSRCCVT